MWVTKKEKTKRMTTLVLLNSQSTQLPTRIISVLTVQTKRAFAELQAVLMRTTLKLLMSIG